ncbi:anti-sigma factor family protein [Anabaena azotica]|uniref:Transcriptional regulator n=1 Tax=Anabaena azotica FACHB-119 TaxID=947527 RepID=A0ABR8D787_9NOST|nr:transcriptional regulator [Anabaena azotica]MBD2502801.1 transcriptional regulator [Anabaena azotica FACHB-119]
MTTDSDFNNCCRQQFSRNLAKKMARHTKEATGAMDMVKRDRFELLSAYLDGEVTAAERKQVEDWLANDVAVQRLYSRLLKLRQGIRTMPIPTTQQSPEVTAQQVITKVNRRSRSRWVFGGAVAACVVGAVSSLLPGREALTPQLAQTQPEQRNQTFVQPSPQIKVALNNPVIEIPKAAVASPEKVINRRRSQLREVPPNIN